MGWREETRKRVKKIMAGGKFKLKEGENTFRVLPNREGLAEPPFVEVMQHRDVGPNKRIVACGKDVDGAGECWLCDKVIPKLMASGKKSNQKLAEVMKAKRQFILQIAVLDDGEWEGPFIFYCPTGGAKSLSTALMSRLSSTKRQYDHPHKGYNLSINRVGTGLQTNYGAVEPDEEPSRVPDEILRKLKKFEDLVYAYDEDRMKAVFYGREDEEIELPKPKPQEEEFDFGGDAEKVEAGGDKEEFAFGDEKANEEEFAFGDEGGDEAGDEGGDGEEDPLADFNFDDSSSEPNDPEGEAEPPVAARTTTRQRAAKKATVKQPAGRSAAKAPARKTAAKKKATAKRRK